METPNFAMMFSGPPVELNPILANRIVAIGSGMKMVQHPLIHSLYFGETDHRMLNMRFDMLTKRLAEIVEKEDWSAFIATHERPYRFDALCEAHYEHGYSGPEFWESLGWAWTDSENINQNIDDWEEIWSSESPGSESVMDEDERAFLANLPDRVEVWRGVGHPDAVLGMSWTLDRGKAEWFAKRFQHGNRTPIVSHGFVEKKNILAYFAGRGESEIVVSRDNVEIS